MCSHWQETPAKLAPAGLGKTLIPPMGVATTTALHPAPLDQLAINTIRFLSVDAIHQCIVRGQYGRGWVDGKKVPGYREEDGVSPDSQTETFVAFRLFVDNWRWQGVPFYLRTGAAGPRTQLAPADRIAGTVQAEGQDFVTEHSTQPPMV
jgi:hypothetical protein